MSTHVEALAERLEGRNLSEVARRAGMSYKNLHRIARGKSQNVYLRTAIRLGEVLDEMDRSEDK